MIKRGIGESVRDSLNSAIFGTIGSEIVITPYTQATSDGGHTGQVETDGTAVTEIAVPFEEIKKITTQKFGVLETGQFKLGLKATATFDISGDTKYKAVWQGDTYDIVSQDRFTIKDVLVAWIITLSKRID